MRSSAHWSSRYGRSGGSAPRGQVRGDLVCGALTRADGTVEEAGPFVGGLGACPEDAVHRLAQPPSVGGPRSGGHCGGGTTGRELVCTPTMIDVVDRVQGGVAEEGGETLEG